MGLSAKDILGASVGLIGAGVGAASNASTNAANKQLAEQANQWNVDMWKRQADYNTPSAQLARLRAGGINPALFYAGGNADPGNVQAAAPSANLANQMAYDGYNPAFQSVASNLLQQKSLQLESARVDNDTQRVTLESVRNDLLVKQFDQHLTEWKDQHIINEQQLTNMKTANENLAMATKQVALAMEGMSQEQKIRAIDLAYEEALKKGELQRMADEHNVSLAEVKEIYANISNAYKQGKLLDQSFQLGGIEYQIKTSEANVASIDAQLREENKNWDKWVGRFEDATGLVGDCVGIIGSSIKNIFRSGGSKPKKK